MAEYPDLNDVWDHNDPEESERRFRELLPLAEGDDGFYVEVLTQVARTHSRRSQFEKAHEILDEAQQRLARCPGGKGEVRYLLERGRAFNSAGKPSEGVVLFEQAYRLASEIKAADLAVDAAHMVAIAHPLPEEQLRWNLETIRYVEQSEDQSVQGWLGPLYNNVGWTYQEQGDNVRALACLEKALLHHSRNGVPKQIFIARWAVAKLLRLNARPAEALDMQKMLQADMTTRGEPDGFVFEELAELLLAWGDANEAARYFGEAYELLSVVDWLVKGEPGASTGCSRVVRKIESGVMAMANQTGVGAGRQLEILTALCNLPTAPYCEQHVIAWLLAWAAQHKEITVRRDKASNVYLEYRRGKKKPAPLVIEAHMDHPGFVVVHQARNGNVTAEFRGGVRPGHFAGTGARFFLEEGAIGHWVQAKVDSVRKVKGQPFLEVKLSGVKERLPKGTLGMWNLPDVAVKGDLLTARVCDDLGGIAGIVCLLERLIAEKVEAHIIGLCSRAEEIGFAGVLAVCENNWIPKRSPVIGLETSKALAHAPQGNGPIIRVGDKTTLFSPGLTHFISQSAGHLADAAPASDPFLYQRKLMDGGTCNSSAFLSYGYDSAAMCVALGNYHNMTIKGDIGWGDGVKAGPGIASETINLRDFAGMVAILVETVKRLEKYEPGLGFLRKRLGKLHHDEQVALLYAKKSR